MPTDGQQCRRIFGICRWRNPSAVPVFPVVIYINSKKRNKEYKMSLLGTALPATVTKTKNQAQLQEVLACQLHYCKVSSYQQSSATNPQYICSETADSRPKTGKPQIGIVKTSKAVVPMENQKRGSQREKNPKAIQTQYAFSCLAAKTALGKLERNGSKDPVGTHPSLE